MDLNILLLYRFFSNLYTLILIKIFNLNNLHVSVVLSALVPQPIFFKYMNKLNLNYILINKICRNFLLIFIKDPA